MASDLQINIELAEALGWGKSSTYGAPSVTVGLRYAAYTGVVDCYTESKGWQVFDYRDPVVFVAICKHWGITTQFRQNAAVLCHDDFSVDYVPSDSIEKAAALLVIDLVKRGVN